MITLKRSLVRIDTIRRISLSSKIEAMGYRSPMIMKQHLFVEAVPQIPY